MSIKLEDLPQEQQDEIINGGYVFALQIIHNANLVLSELNTDALPKDLEIKYKYAVKALKTIETTLINSL